MSVGKAEAHSPDRAASTGFSCVVPCLSTVDEAAIKDWKDDRWPALKKTLNGKLHSSS